MNRRGFLRLLAGGVAAFRAIGLPTSKIEKTIFGSGDDGDLILSDNQTLPRLSYVAYDKVDLKGWSFTMSPNGDFLIHHPGTNLDEERRNTPEGNPA